jgi:hypothetical protein
VHAIHRDASLHRTDCRGESAVRTALHGATSSEPSALARRRRGERHACIAPCASNRYPLASIRRARRHNRKSGRSGHVPRKGRGGAAARDAADRSSCPRIGRNEHRRAPPVHPAADPSRRVEHGGTPQGSACVSYTSAPPRSRSRDLAARSSSALVCPPP